jgi:hypothetical protein
LSRFIASPARTSAIGLLLCLPLAVLFVTAWFQLEPLNGLLMGPTTVDGRVMTPLAIMLLLGSVLALPVALVVNALPAIHSRLTGRRLTIAPLNLLLGLAILSVMLFVAGAIVVDQYPCLVGVPNCD